MLLIDSWRCCHDVAYIFFKAIGLRKILDPFGEGGRGVVPKGLKLLR